MRRLTPLTALCLGMLLFAAPAAWACDEFGTMPPQCPMGEMAESMGSSMCHDDGDRMAEDCCDITSTPEPMQALSVENPEFLSVPQVTDLQVVAPLAAAAPTLHSADALRPPDLGRYTLFSSFLL